MHVNPVLGQHRCCLKTSLMSCLFPSGSALDINFSDISVASLDKELEEQDSVGLASKKPPFLKADHK